MAHLQQLLKTAIAACFVFAGQAIAGYAQPAPPSGWGGSAGSWTYKAANASEWVTGTVRTNAALNVGGRSVVIPAALRVAANAPTFAARFMFANPLLVTAAGVAYLASHYITWDPAQGKWLYSDTSSTSYYVSEGGSRQLYRGTYYYALSPFCTAAAAYIKSQYPTAVTQSCSPYNGYYLYLWQFGGTGQNYQQYSIASANSTCPAGWYVTDSGCVQTLQPTQVPQDEEAFVERVAPQIQPAQVPEVLPSSVPIPVEQPVINPSADPVPQPRPLRVPVGDPQLVPGTDPAQWRQPVIRVSPAPSSSTPWQVDLTPEDIVSTDPTPLREPTVEPLPEGSTPEATDTDDLCLKNPDILACQKEVKLGELQPVPLTNEDRELEIDADTGQTAACPSPASITVAGRTVNISYDLICQFADMVRPLFIGFAWLSAALTFMGFARRS